MRTSNAQKQRETYALATFWACVVGVYLVFGLRIHMHETYAYASSAMGLFDFKEGHLAVSPWLANYGAFGAYHPNHPLLNILGLALLRPVQAGFASVDLIQILASINTLAALGGACMFYRLLEFLYPRERVFHSLIVALWLFLDINWFSAQSGEGYIAGQCFAWTATYCLFRYLREPRRARALLYAGCFGVSFAFHAKFALLLPLHIWMVTTATKGARSEAKRREVRAPLAWVSAILLAFVSAFYFLPYFFHLQARTPVEMVRLFFFYGDEMGAWTQPFQGLGDGVVKLLLLPAVSGLVHLHYAALDGVDGPTWAARALLLLASLLAVTRVAKSRDRVDRFFLAWFLLYFSLTAFIIHIPTDLTYWTFTAPAFVFLLGQGLRGLPHKSVWAGALVAIFFLINFAYDIYPKHRADPETYFHLDRIKAQLAPAGSPAHSPAHSNDTAIVFALNDTYAETSYVNYFGMVWHAAQDPTLKSLARVVILDAIAMETKLRDVAAQHPRLLVISNPGWKSGTDQALIDTLARLGYRRGPSETVEQLYRPELDKTSEFYHPRFLFDSGPLGERWPIFLTTYVRATEKVTHFAAGRLPNFGSVHAREKTP